MYIIIDVNHPNVGALVQQISAVHKQLVKKLGNQKREVVWTLTSNSQNPGSAHFKVNLIVSLCEKIRVIAVSGKISQQQTDARAILQDIHLTTTPVRNKWVFPTGNNDQVFSDKDLIDLIYKRFV